MRRLTGNVTRFHPSGFEKNSNALRVLASAVREIRRPATLPQGHKAPQLLQAASRAASETTATHLTCCCCMMTAALCEMDWSAMAIDVRNDGVAERWILVLLLIQVVLEALRRHCAGRELLLWHGKGRSSSAASSAPLAQPPLKPKGRAASNKVQFSLHLFTGSNQSHDNFGQALNILHRSCPSLTVTSSSFCFLLGILEIFSQRENINLYWHILYK